MFKILFIIYFSLVSTIFSQDQDLDFCDVNKIEGDPLNLKIPNIPDDAQFQATYERNLDGLTEDSEEYFDSRNNVGISKTIAGGMRTFAYAYYPTNELLFVSGDECRVFMLNQSYELTPFQLQTDQLGNEHIVSPLTVALRNFKFVYTGKLVIRGVPVNQWQTCTYSSKDKKTRRITVSYSDPDKWLPATPLDNFNSIPVEIKTEYKKDNKVSTELTSIFQFRPFLLLEIEDYTVPPGVYCPNRLNLKKLPEIPKSFSFTLQLVEALPGTNDRAGIIQTFREEYDYNYKLFRFDYDKKDHVVTEIHDFTTGLNYIIDRKTGECLIDKLVSGQIDSESDDGSYVQMRDPTAFFDFDGGDYQYNGFKRQDGINTDVWIGKKVLNGYNSTLEWYFLADTWNITEVYDQKYKIPIKLIIYSYRPNPQNPQNLVYTKFVNNFFSFRKTELNLIDFDISRCVEDLRKESFVFTVPASNRRVIRSNIEKFKQAVAIAIQKIARVVLLRVGRPNVVIYDDYIFVTFSLYERSKIYGNVLVPKDDLLLNDAIVEMENFFKTSSIEITFIDDFGNEVKILGDKNSISTNVETDGYVVYNVEDIKKGYSGGAVFAVVAVFGVLGILVSLLITLLQKQKKINLPVLKSFDRD